jgi:hypothetical protein
LMPVLSQLIRRLVTYVTYQVSADGHGDWSRKSTGWIESYDD